MNTNIKNRSSESLRNPKNRAEKILSIAEKSADWDEPGIYASSIIHTAISRELTTKEFKLEFDNSFESVFGSEYFIAPDYFELKKQLIEFADGIYHTANHAIEGSRLASDCSLRIEPRSVNATALVEHILDVYICAWSSERVFKDYMYHTAYVLCSDINFLIYGIENHEEIRAEMRKIIESWGDYQG